jgi:hypothetical protein
MLMENLILTVSGAICGLLVIAWLARPMDGWLAAGAQGIPIPSAQVPEAT